MAVTLNGRFTPDELEFTPKDNRTKRLIFDSDFSSAVPAPHNRGDKSDITTRLQISKDDWETTTENFAASYRSFLESGSTQEPVSGASDDDMLYIIYMSGATSLPSGVVHTHDSRIWALLKVNTTASCSHPKRFL